MPDIDKLSTQTGYFEGAKDGKNTILAVANDDGSILVRSTAETYLQDNIIG